ncbi:hypothetical protein LAZ67_16001128 [Cordylochernes scorpioides]|uniref:Reverse transcriptase domain-containing protein n=1 Tax=Cordylochernes scorpioides TaxID=51811 RepID=A0ABY6LB38_9ARAC|nr:hypothetical protein LAZ67_16001128 [Cordylochernes scorpioides]
MGFEDTPNYNHVRDILRTAIKKAGFKDDGLVSFSKESPPTPRKSTGNTPKQQQPKVGAKRKSKDEVPATTPIKKRKPPTTSLVQSTSPKKVFKPTLSTPGRHRGTYYSKASAAARNTPGPLDNPTPAMLQVLNRKKELQTGNGQGESPVPSPKESVTPSPPSSRRPRRYISPASIANTKDRGFLVSLMVSLRLPQVFIGWFLLLYAGADATVRAGGLHTKPFQLLNGVRQGCVISAAMFSLATSPLLRRLEQALGPGNVLAYADDIVLLIHSEEQFGVVTSIFENFRRA